MRAFGKSTTFIDMMFETLIKEENVEKKWIIEENNKIKRKRK
jgi:hypothetical protein